MKAVTSTKLSSTCRTALVGFGVRKDGVVYGHSHLTVACEVIDLGSMATVCVLADHEDEVNIAQFHPLPGNGVLYGTKKGKIRKYQRTQQLQPAEEEGEEGYMDMYMYGDDEIPEELDY